MVANTLKTMTALRDFMEAKLMKIWWQWVNWDSVRLLESSPLRLPAAQRRLGSPPWQCSLSHVARSRRFFGQVERGSPTISFCFPDSRQNWKGSDLIRFQRSRQLWGPLTTIHKKSSSEPIRTIDRRILVCGAKMCNIFFFCFATSLEALWTHYVYLNLTYVI